MSVEMLLLLIAAAYGIVSISLVVARAGLDE